MDLLQSCKDGQYGALCIFLCFVYLCVLPSHSQAKQLSACVLLINTQSVSLAKQQPFV